MLWWSMMAGLIILPLIMIVIPKIQRKTSDVSGSLQWTGWIVLAATLILWSFFYSDQASELIVKGMLLFLIQFVIMAILAKQEK